MIQCSYLQVKYKLKLHFALSEWPSHENQLTTHASVDAGEGSPSLHCQKIDTHLNFTQSED